MMKTENMRNILLFGLYFVLSLNEAFGESEYEMKRGTYPYMAFVYYPDASIVGPTGIRFTRSAVIIRPDWLISSSLETNDTQLAFPQKTLIVRAGAVVIDSNFNVNEDEGEQDREIIQIIRPTKFTAVEWWNNDITLLKTLLPFNMTSTVALTTLYDKHAYTDKTCYILIFGKKYVNSTDDKLLMQLAVELLPTTNENCGTHFRNETMICASNSDENKNIAYDPNFCHSNSGGPLICENDVIGLQTYIDNSCKPPYVYQLLSAWDDFIKCGIEDKCRTQQCANICTNIDKDDDTFSPNEIMMMSTAETVKDNVMEQSIEESNDEERLTLPDLTTDKVMIVTENNTPTATTSPAADITTAKETTPLATTETEERTTGTTEDVNTSWPKEKLMGYHKRLDEGDSSENMERTSNVEAQHHEAKKKGRGAGESNVIRKMGIIHNLSVILLFLTCNI